MPSIPFAKASACGNDFLVIDITHAKRDISGLTRRLCDRHNGVGADGVEWLMPSTSADIEARLINADGSEAEVSGNGTRCVAACIAEHAVEANHRHPDWSRDQDVRVDRARWERL